jgi:MHS family proline/betaine transporter-like MFS transporter
LYGHLVQSFSNALYGFLTVVIANVFFKASDSELVRLMSSYGAYTAGYLAMPVGALFLGMYGDKYGRKVTILISTICSGFFTILIGCIPVYDSIGIIAPLLLIIIRLFHGLCYGTEYSGVFVYNYEISEMKEKVGSSSALLSSFGVLGACIAAIFGAVIGKEFMLNGGWRVLFWCAGILNIVIFFIRLKIVETYDYKSAKTNKALSKTPYKDLLKLYKLGMITGIFLSAFNLTVYCVSVIYGSKLFQEYGMSFQDSMIYCVPVTIYFSVVVYCVGEFSDKFGIEKQIIIGLILMLIASPFIFYLLTYKLTVFIIYSYMILIITASSVTTSCCSVLIAEFFPVECRYSGTSVCNAVGALLGSFSLFVCLFLIENFKSRFATVIWVYFIVLGALVGILLIRRKRGRIGFNVQ